MNRWFILALSFPLFLNAHSTINQLQALMVLGDDQLAMQEAHQALLENPGSKEICEAAVKIYAHAGAEEQMMAYFRYYQKLACEDLWPRDLLEDMAWGVIRKGSKGTAPLTRAIALIAAAIGNDARGVEILLENSRDSHRLVRAMVIQFSSHFRDESLQEMIKERMKLEKDREVRVALLQAIGPMQIAELEPELLTVLENDKARAEEKAAALASLVLLKENSNLSEIKKFLSSNRAALRLLAAELIGADEITEMAPSIAALLNDTHAEVRRAALETLGALRLKEVDGKSVPKLIMPLIQDSIPEVAIAASWLLMLYEPLQGQEWMKKWLKSPHQDERIFAACALKAAGQYGRPLNQIIFEETEDPFVKLNLGIALITEQIDPKRGSDALYQLFMEQKGRWMPYEQGRFSGIAPCTVSHKPDVPNFPEVVNQITRLEVLNILAVQGHPQAKEAVLVFLKEKSWGVSGAASSLLLTEGDEESLVIIRQLLKDESEKVQLQAGLILALWGNDPEAIETLQRLYSHVPQDKKAQVLEALGRIGDFSTIPFLVARLEESQQTLRMIAAAAILQTLYH